MPLSKLLIVFLIFYLQCSSYVDTASILKPQQFLEDNVPSVDEADAAVCSPVLRTFAVKLNSKLASNEKLGLTGDAKALGAWQLEGSVALSPSPTAADEWYTSVLLQSCRNINYRYFIYAEDDKGQKLIRLWETMLKPRTLDACMNNCRQQLDTFGEIQSNRGWLTSDVIIQLKFEREKMFQVHDIEKFDPDNIYIRLEPVEQQLGLRIEVVKMQYSASHLQTQPTAGISYKKGDTIIFHITKPLSLQSSYNMCFYNKEGQLLGKALIEESDLKGSEGELLLKIKEPAENSTAVLSHLMLPYVLVRPFSQVQDLDFRTTYAHYWPKTWPNLDVGHRGNGKSYIAQPPSELENTVVSFMRAYNSHADMVELDVHVTADGVPVIYHDFGLRTAPQGKNVTDASQLEYVLIKDVSYETLKNLRVFAIIEGKVSEYTSHNAQPVKEKRIFPTLEDILAALPNTLGIDVEIKWPQRKIGGGVEAEQTIDKNFFIDRILEIILQKGCGRPLIFSSFDADVCTMLRFKQNLLPVMLLTQGETKKWEAFLSLRARNVLAAINNAQAFELAGTAPHAEDFMGEQGAELIQKSKAVGQITLIWGDDCNSKQAVKYFQDIGATATCYDRSDLYVPADKERSFFNSSAMMAEFEDQCRKK